MDPRERKILSLVTPDKVVLNLGCAQNIELHELLAKNAEKITGVDINEKNLAQFRELGYDVICQNVENMHLKHKYDYIID